jgi:glucose-6-phosphate 1-dehydrogenase
VEYSTHASGVKIVTQQLATPPRTAQASSNPRSDAHADLLVVFGITGDLAKVMTFRSLYRLEQRGPLKCPILGVAVNDWSLEQLREPWIVT